MGQPDAVSLLERLHGGGSVCEEVVECRYFNEEVEAWTTDGCFTVELEGGLLGCECSHLSDFIAIKVGRPTERALLFAPDPFRWISMDVAQPTPRHASHLSPPSRHKVPSAFTGTVEFVQLDIGTAVTLHCECVQGVQVTLQKGRQS